jgi:hypothetical protein
MDSFDKEELQIEMHHLHAEVEIVKSNNLSLQKRIEMLEDLVFSGCELASFALQRESVKEVSSIEGPSLPGPPVHSSVPNLSGVESLRSLPVHNTDVPNVTSGDDLRSIEEVLSKYPHLHSEKNSSRLAVKLAREAVFGKSFMAKSTPLGNREYLALPSEGLYWIKSTIQNVLPYGRSNLIEFEKTWKICQNAIGQACKHLRDNAM